MTLRELYKDNKLQIVQLTQGSLSTNTQRLKNYFRLKYLQKGKEVYLFKNTFQRIVSLGKLRILLVYLITIPVSMSDKCYF